MDPSTRQVDNSAIYPYVKGKRPSKGACFSLTSGRGDKSNRSNVSKLDAENTVRNNVENHTTMAATTPTGSSSSLPSVSAQASALVISAAAKPGMDGIDRDKIDRIILRESGNSLYMEQQRRRDGKVNDRISRMKEELKALGESYKDVKNKDKLDEALKDFQQQQPTRSACVVVDLDMFYFGCELLTRPDLRYQPACVGNGMILTSNYVARRYGVRSAMPGFIGDKLVEELSGGTERLIHIRPNYDLYKEKSRIVKEILREFDPRNMKSYSLDEAYLDLAPYLALYLRGGGTLSHEEIHANLLTPEKGDGSERDAMQVLQSYSSFACLQAASEVVSFLRHRIQQVTGGLTCSVGVAPNIAIAKIASDTNKPNGQLLVDPSQLLKFVHTLPVRKIPGIGRVTEKILHEVFDVVTVRDLYLQRHLVNSLFKPSTAEFLLRASVGCNGIGGLSSSDFGMDEDHPFKDTSSVVVDHQKGISRERTFAPESDWVKLNVRLEDIARMLSADMMKISVMAHTVTVKVKLKTFHVLTRSQSLKIGAHVQTPEELVTIASRVFAQLRSEQGRVAPFSVRLLGIRCTNLKEESTCHTPQPMALNKFLTITQSPFANENRVTESANSTRIVNRYTNIQPNFHTKNPERMPHLHQLSTSKGGDDSEIKKSGRSGERNKRKDVASSCAKRNCTVPDVMASCIFKSGQNGKNQGNEETGGRHILCPLCNCSFDYADNDGLNAHIDSCLNGATVRRIIAEEQVSMHKPTTSSSFRKRQCLDDFWQAIHK